MHQMVSGSVKDLSLYFGSALADRFDRRRIKAQEPPQPGIKYLLKSERECRCAFAAACNPYDASTKAEK
jgi:hypothetical protein